MGVLDRMRARAAAAAPRGLDPAQAVSRLERAFEPVRELDGMLCPGAALPRDHRAMLHRALDDYAAVLQGLRVDGPVSPEAASRLGELVAVLGRHLDEVPRLLLQPVISLWLEGLADRLEEADPPPARHAGERLREIRTRARERVEQALGPPPAGPPRAAGAPRTLDRETLLRELLGACAVAGSVPEQDAQALEELRRLLGIPDGEFCRLRDEAGAQGRVQLAEDHGEMQPVAFLACLDALAREDGVLTSEEEELLAATAHFLGVTRAEFDALRDRVAAGSEPGRGEPTAAREGDEAAPEDLDAALEAGDARAAALHHRAAELLLDQGRAGEARPLLQEARRILAESGETGLASARVQNALGRALQVEGEYAAAEAAFRQALADLSALSEPEPREEATLHNNLGVLFRLAGRLEEALEEHRRARTRRAEALGEDHPEYGASLVNAGVLALELGLAEEAGRLLEEARENWEASLGEGHRRVGDLLANLGHAYRRLGRPEAAREAHERALRVLEASHGPRHASLVPPLLGLAAEHRDRGDDVAAARLVTRARALQARD